VLIFTFRFRITEVGIVKIGLLKGLIRDAGLTNEEYLALFHSKKRR